MIERVSLPVKQGTAVQVLNYVRENFTYSLAMVLTPHEFIDIAGEHVCMAPLH